MKSKKLAGFFGGVVSQRLRDLEQNGGLCFGVDARQVRDGKTGRGSAFVNAGVAEIDRHDFIVEYFAHDLTKVLWDQSGNLNAVIDKAVPLA